MSKKPLYVLDLDRTLIDTDKIVELLEEVLNQQGFDSSTIVEKIERARLSENDIDAKEAIDSLGIGAWKAVEKYFLQESMKDKLVFDDARSFLGRIRSADLPHIILTFGVSRAWQSLKLKSAGLEDVPSIVSNSREKSRTINGWRSENGVYTPPGFAKLSASNIVLVDDRPGAFLDISDNNLKGYLINRSGKLGADFVVPEKVSVISSLSEIEIQLD